MTLDPIDGQASRLSETALSSEKLRRFAERYPARLRAPVLGLATADPRLAQAMRVFPGLLAELARKPAGCPVRQTCTRLILDGAPLKDVARAAGLPLWIRRLPPEAFEKPLPKRVAALLPSHEIANHLPRSPKRAASWLEVMIEAANVCDGRFAVWLAREQARWPKGFSIDSARALGLFAWHAINARVRSPVVPHAVWSVDQGTETATKLARRWYEQLELALTLDNTVTAPWLDRCTSNEFDFLPLLTAPEIDAEAKAMRNCLLTYGPQVRMGRTQLWSIRRSGERSATLAVRPLHDSSIVTIQQLVAADNKQAPPDVWLAAYRWIAEQPGPGAPRRTNVSSCVELSRASWIAAWRPYWTRKRALPSWLPLAPSRGAIWELHSQL